MRYSFELCGDEATDRHPTNDLPSLEAAKQEAMRFAAEVLKDRSADQRNDADWCLEVKDDRARIVFRIDVKNIEARPIERKLQIFR